MSWLGVLTLVLLWAVPLAHLREIGDLVGVPDRGAAAHVLASATAWPLWLATVLNVFENLAFLHVLRSGPAGPLWSLASAVFTLRSALLLGGLAVGICLHVSTWLGAAAGQGAPADGGR